MNLKQKKKKRLKKTKKEVISNYSSGQNPDMQNLK